MARRVLKVEKRKETDDDGKVFSFESYYFSVVVILLSTR